MKTYKSEDIDKALKRVGDLAREQAFPKGNPIIYMKNGKMGKGFPDGRIVEFEGLIDE